VETLVLKRMNNPKLAAAAGVLMVAAKVWL
jgi:hypothetical protein